MALPQQGKAGTANQATEASVVSMAPRLGPDTTVAASGNAIRALPRGSCEHTRAHCSWLPHVSQVMGSQASPILTT